MRVLVLDGNQNQAVASVRSLTRRGYTVYVGAATGWSKAGWSRFCAGSFQYPAPDADAAGFIANLLDKLRETGDALILPGGDAATLLVSANRDALLAAGARIVMPAHEEIVRALDKNETTRLAKQLGVPVPNTWVVGNVEEAQRLAASIPYPVVLKPQSSEELSSSAGTRTAGRPRYASNSEQFADAFSDLSQRASSVLVQEFIPGGGTGYFALMCHGELRAEFAHRRIRDVHPTGSGSALRESTAPDPRVKEASLAILRALNWHGAAMVEFRMRPDGTPVFLEVNGRFWNSLPLACYSGVDFPALVAQIAEHGDIPPALGYRSGVRCRWFLGDFRHLVAVWAGPPTGYPGTFPGRWQTLASVLIPVPGTYHDNFQMLDPLPELGDWLATLGRARSRSRRKESTNA